MIHSKAKIFNLALGALLLQRQIINTDTDTSNEANILNTHWDVAYQSTLEDLDLDSTSSPVTLQLLEAAPNDLWDFVYKYPPECIFFRRIITTSIIDNRSSHIPKRVGMHDGQKGIFTDEENATAEYIPSDIPISSFSPNLGLAVAYRLAILSAPLVVGKGAAKLRTELEARYVITKTEAQEKDRRENFNFYHEAVDSEFVEARLS